MNYQKNFFFLLLLIFFSGNIALSQVDNFITQYDPYILSLKNYTFYYPVDDDPLTGTSNFIIVLRANIGNQKDAFIKFITADQVGFDNAREFEDGYIQTVTSLVKKGILVPPSKDVSGSYFLDLTLSGYADLTDADYEKIKKIAGAQTIPVSTSLINSFTGIYNNYPTKNDIYKPSDEGWAEAQAFLAGMDTRKKVDLGSITFKSPMIADIKNITATENLAAGDRTIENKKAYAIAILNFESLRDELMVYEQDYYKKLYGIFLKLAGNKIYQEDYFKIVDELGDFKAAGFKDRDDVYITPEAKKQLGNVLEVFILSTPIKVDTNKTSDGMISIEGQVVIDYFRENIGSDKDRLNKYIYLDYLSNDINKVKLQRDIDLIRDYYKLR
jgi:hypothetical protein